MQMLIIGLDGGDRQIINAMDMPRLRSLLDSGRSVTLTEDLWTRGWAETLTGAPGTTMHGFYMKPKCDGTRTFIESFNGKDYDNPDLDPLWSRLNRAGKKIGFMNVPTTSPVPEVDGFIVGGAGGGRGAGSGIDPKTCWPREVAQKLEASDYMFDTRLGQVEVKSHDAFFDRLKFMLEKRTDVYLTLCKDYGVDVGYLAYMGTTRAQYLAMSELESMIVSSEMNAAEATRATEPRPLQKLLLDLYKFQDEQIGRLIDELKPEHWIVLADHGSVPMHYKLNLNAFLRRHGFQAARKNAGLKSAVKKVARLVVPRSMRKSVGKKANKIITAIGNDTDWEHTRAFSHRFYGGIYVNDRERFGGLAISKEETDRLTDEIVQAINNDPEAKKHRLSARPFRREHADNPRQQTFPDVFVEAPDGYFFEYFGQAVERNHNYGPIDSILEATNDMYTGMKGKHPIFCVSESLAGHIRDGDPDDLRLAYRIVERQFADESVE